MRAFHIILWKNLITITTIALIHNKLLPLYYVLAFSTTFDTRIRSKWITYYITLDPLKVFMCSHSSRAPKKFFFFSDPFLFVLFSFWKSFSWRISNMPTKLLNDFSTYLMSEKFLSFFHWFLFWTFFAEHSANIFTSSERKQYFHILCPNNFPPDLIFLSRAIK